MCREIAAIELTAMVPSVGDIQSKAYIVRSFQALPFRECFFVVSRICSEKIDKYRKDKYGGII